MLAGTTGTPNPEWLTMLYDCIREACMERERREAEQAEAVEVPEYELVEE